MQMINIHTCGCIIIIPPMVVDHILNPLFSSSWEQWVIDERKDLSYTKNTTLILEDDD